MLSIGELHDMGLSRGFRPESLYGRDTYGLEAAALEVANSNVALQQQLNDLISNSFLQTPLQHQCLGLFFQSSDFAYPGLTTSMGFSQPDSFLLDDLPPVMDHYIPVSSSADPPPPASSFAPVGVHQQLQQRPELQQQTWVDEKFNISPRGLKQPELLQQTWVDEKFDVSPRGLKRDGGIDQTSPQPRKKPDRSSRTIDVKSKRPVVEQAGDHILRERQRRDDMTSKFAVLESLLPIGVKRDRSTIVDDSIEYVKNLHHRIKSLLERKLELSQASNQRPGACRRGPIEMLQPGCGSSPLKEQAPVSLCQRPRISEEETKGIHEALRSCLEKMEVHADLPHQVVIEMVCKPQPSLQSNILFCMESLRLDVVQCSITKIAHRFICVITANSQEENTGGIVASLKRALQR